MTKTIMFDVGGVITNTDFRMVYSNFARRVGLAPEFVIEYHERNINALLLGDITLQKFWEDMQNGGADLSADLQKVWIDEGVKNRKINKELLEIIKKLRENYSIGVLTNLTPSRWIIDQVIGLYSYFDYAVLSYEVHAKKPDPEFYQLGLKAASAKPEEAIFIDDQEDCIAGAKSLGMRTIRYQYPDNSKLIECFRQFGISI